ncbi:MAG: tetratricopeptide repeat protein [Spirochaetales bacterium]|nr:tetratricopeptide repeat protein [Spirochaetales bacterium]
MENRLVIRFISALLFLSVLLSGCESGVPPEEVAQVYYNLGNAYFELEKYSLAVTAYLNALALDDTLPQAGYNLARVYIESGDYKQGLAALSELLKQDPGNSLVLSTIGWTHYLSAEYEEALGVFDEILQRTPTDRRGLYNAAVLALKLDRKEDALGYFQRLYSETAEAETLYRIAALYVDLERWEEAVEALTEYLAKNPDDADAYYDLGIAYAAERYYGKALDAFQAGIELKKNDPLLHFEKAVVLLLYIENVDEGLKALTAAVENGFKDTERISALLGADELLFKEEVRSLFKEKGVLPEEAPATGP